MSEKDYSIFDGLQKLVDYFGEKYPKLYKPVVSCYVLYTINNIINRLVFINNGYKKAKKLIRDKKDYWNIALFTNYLPIRVRMQVLVLVISPKLYRKVIERII